MNTNTLVILYLVAIIAANLLVAEFGPSVTPIAAFLLIGFDLSSRDRLHEAWRGRQLWPNMAALIASGSVLSYLLNADAGPIALASFVAFAVAGVTDALVYHLLGGRAYLVRVNGSNVVSAAVDSLLFPTIAFGAFLPWIVLGQFVAKVAGGAVWAWVLSARRTEVV